MHKTSYHAVIIMFSEKDTEMATQFYITKEKDLQQGPWKERGKENNFVCI